MPDIAIGSRMVGAGHPVFIVAEMSCNHRQSLDTALGILCAAKEAGADALKVQAYAASSLTLESGTEPFQIRSGLWVGRTLWDLYSEGAMPWEWLPILKAEADRLGLILFPSVFAVQDIPKVAVIDPPAYKVASFEATDLPLVRALGKRGKPLILSTGMASLNEINAAIAAADEGIRDRVKLPENRMFASPAPLALLKCTSAYPAPVSECNLRAIAGSQPQWQDEFGIELSASGARSLPSHWRRYPIGLSDHTRSNAVVAAAVALGACLVERHLKLSDADDGPDAAFSDTPEQFAAMVKAIRETEAALGVPHFGPTPSEEPMLRYRRSLWIVRDVAEGEILTPENVRSLRPTGGLEPAELPRVLGKQVRQALARGTALQWEMVEDPHAKDLGSSA